MTTRNSVVELTKLSARRGTWTAILDRNDGRMANTKSITDKEERKKVKRAARKKATAKAKRDYPRGSKKKKVKKLARGQSKR